MTPGTVQRRSTRLFFVAAFAVFALAVGLTVPAALARSASLRIDVDGLTNGQAVAEAMPIQGWAADPEAGEGTGVTGVLVFLDGEQGAGMPIEGVEYGLPRPDIAAALGGDRFLNAGFSVMFDPAMAGAGQHTLYFYAVGADGTTVAAQRTVTTGGVAPVSSPPAPPPPPAPPGIQPPPPPPPPPAPPG